MTSRNEKAQSDVTQNHASQSRASQGHPISAAALAGWGALLWLAFSVAPYLYALNDLVQWR